MNSFTLFVCLYLKRPLKRAEISIKYNKIKMEKSGIIGIIIAIVALSTGVYFRLKENRRREKNINLLRDFENRMYIRGFTRRIVVYDFFSELSKKIVNKNSKPRWTVGIWINYEKQLIALRTGKDAWTEIDISFDKIQCVEIIKNGCAITNDGAVISDNDQSNGDSKGLKVKIVAEDISSGAKVYFLNLELTSGAKFSKFHLDHNVIQKYVQSIANEINNIIRHTSMIRLTKLENRDLQYIRATFLQNGTQIIPASALLND